MGCILRTSHLTKCKEERCIHSRGLACCFACSFGKNSGCNHACEYIAAIWKKEKSKQRRHANENK